MKISIKKTANLKGRDCLVLPVFKKMKPDRILQQYPELAPLWKKFRFRGNAGEGFSVNSGSFSTLLVAVGAGSPDVSADAAKCARKTLTMLGDNRSEKAVIRFPGDVEPATGYVTNFTDFLFLNGYHFDRYQNRKNRPIKIKSIDLVFSGRTRIPPGLIRERQSINDQVIRVRDLINEIPASLNPDTLVDVFRQAAQQQQLPISVMREKELAEKGLNGLLAVGRGSPFQPTLIRMVYAPPESGKTVVLVGKGITFDSGGLNIKISNYMEDMKCDMAGAATVMGIIGSVARLNCPVKIIALVPVAENMPGNKAYKPGDIITYANRKSVEVVNTDAEGRLILADALIQAVSEKPDYIIEFSTLTGAIVIALGDMIAGLMCTRSGFSRMLENSADRTCDFLWPLPMPEEYRESIKSKIADLKNADYKGASSIKAGLFLSEFVGKVPFAHIDIAGTAFISKPNPYYAVEGATGFGVRLAVDFISRLGAV